MSETHSIHIKVDSTDAQKASKNLSDMEKATNGAERAINNLTKAALGLVTLEALKRTAAYAIEAADSFTLMSSKLKLATSSQEEFTKAQTALFRIAQANSTELASTVDLYTRMSRGMKDMGSSQADILRMTNAVGQALKISGASTSEASSVITQFGQALGSGVLRGEEFNAIMENGDRLARALADGIGVPLGSLRKLAEQGALTGDVVTKAILSQTSALESESSTMQTTVSQAWTQLENAVVTYIGQADQANGTTKDLSDSIVTLAKNFADLADPVAHAISYIAKVEVGGWLALSEAISSAKIALQEMVGIQQAGTSDPETLKLMKMSQGQMSIDEIAGKKAESTEKTVAKAAAATGIHLASTGKAAKKAADDALKAFQSTIEANVKAAENASKIFSAQMDNRRKRYEIEADQIKGIAELQIRATKSESMRLSIAEEAQTKIVDAINQETNLRQETLAKEMEITQAKLNGNQQELDAADAHKLKQSERIELLTKQSELETEMAVKRQEQVQIELDAIDQIQSAERDLAEARQQANEALVKEEALRQLEIMSSNLEYAKEMATGLAQAFGEVGAAIGGMSVAMAEYEKQSATVEIARTEAVAKAEGDQTRIAEINDEAAKKQARAQIKAYGDMTQAAQGFFKKGTTGYKSLESATKVFRAFEIAQSAMSMMKQMSDMGSILAQFIGMETAKTAAKITSNATQQASDATGAVTSATKAVADAGQGDPYTGIIRAAAMLAFMAAIGIAVGGGGGGGSPAKVSPADNSGTGTVYGDPNAQSESISKSLDILTENSSNDLNYTADMLDALLAIKDSLGGVTDLIAGSFMPLIESFSAQFPSDSLKKSGFIFDVQKFMDIYKSGRFTGSLGARYEWEDSSGAIKHGETIIKKYGKAYEYAFGEVVKSVADSLKLSGEKLGISGETFMQRMKNFTINLGIVDIAGMSAEEASKKIEAVLSSMSDLMAAKALPEFKKFRQVGEGYAQTVNRVAEGYTRAEGQLELLGMTIIDLTDIEKKRGDVAAEAVRQTIMAQGDLSEGTRLYVKQLTGSSEDIIDAYKQIMSITNLMRGAGFGTENIDRTMINAAGGLSAFEDALQSFRDNFMSDAQKVQADSDELSRAFGKLGIEMPKTKDEFYTIAMGMDRSTDAGKKLFAQFILLSGQFSDLADSAKQLADDQYQAEVDAHDKLISGLQKNVDTAFSAMQKSYQDLQKVQDRFLAISKNLRSYLSDLTGGSSAFMSPEARYRTAKAEFSRLSALAAAGNESALGQLTSAGKTFLDASRDYNASSTQFQSDFAAVTRTIESSAAYAETQVDVAEQQLNIAESSYSQLKTLDTSVLSVRDAIGNLTAAMGKYADEVAALAAAPAAPVLAPVVISAPTTGVTPGVSGGSAGMDLIDFMSANPVGPFFPGTSSGLFDNNTSLMGPFPSSSSGNNNAQLAQTMQSVATETKASVNVQQEAFSQMIVSLSSIDSRLSDMERNQRLSA